MTTNQTRITLVWSSFTKTDKRTFISEANIWKLGTWSLPNLPNCLHITLVRDKFTEIVSRYVRYSLKGTMILCHPFQFCLHSNVPIHTHLQCIQSLALFWKSQKSLPRNKQRYVHWRLLVPKRKLQMDF